MGKLVIYLADGTTTDVPLTKERITIGRRADNDVCLPYPAVSGEHAQVVTILADSFLEDLGSTNGTLVNGKAITKHFLTDNDQIDIGRQRLTYLSHDDAKPAYLPPDSARAQLQGLLDRVTPATLPQVKVPPSGRSAPRVSDQPELAAARAAMPAATPRPAPAARVEPRGTDVGAGTSRLPSPASLRLADSAPSAPAADPAAVAPTVRVLSGSSAGRRVPFTGPELTIGRVGVQVARVQRTGDGYRLIPLEGAEPPRINGAPVAPEGSPLHPGDTFEVAGVRLELSADA